MKTDGIDLGDDFLEGGSPALLDDDFEPKKNDVDPEPEPKPEPKKRGPKPKVEPTPEPTKDPEPEPEPTPEPEPDADEDEESLITGLAAKLGYELGEDESYEETEEGLVAFIQKQQEIGAQQMVDNYFQSVHPKAAEMFDLVNMISDLPIEEQDKILDDFYKGKSPEIDFESVNLEEEATQKSVLKTFYKKNGFSDEQITKKLDKFEIAGMLKDEAADAIEHLVKLQKDEAKKILEKEKKEAETRKEQTKKYYQTLQSTIESGKINNFVIPVNERKATFDYIAKGDALNKLNEMWSTPEGRIQLAIMLKNDFKLDKYIDTAAKTKQVSSLKQKLEAGKSKLKSSDPRSNSNPGDDWDKEEISFAKK